MEDDGVALASLFLACLALLALVWSAWWDVADDIDDDHWGSNLMIRMVDGLELSPSDAYEHYIGHQSVADFRASLGLDWREGLSEYVAGCEWCLRLNSASRRHLVELLAAYLEERLPSSSTSGEAHA